jgi:hypothetical protein
MVVFSFRSSASLLPWLCAGLVVAVLVDGAHASGPQQQQKQLRVGNNRYLQEDVALTSDAPSLVPSQPPSDAPSLVPSASPTAAPTDPPSDSPSNVPSVAPSSIPSDMPSAVPNSTPSAAPSDVPSTNPSVVPSAVPSAVPSTTPSTTPSNVPSDLPSTVPSAIPSGDPSITPSNIPSTVPTPTPSATPSAIPSDVPSITPSNMPSTVPSSTPSTIPSDGPSYVPSDVPSAVPSHVPSAAPSGLPSDVPSLVPSVAPSAAPSGLPSDVPSQVPSVAPSAAPSDLPSQVPSDIPSGAPSDIFSGMPSDVPSSVPSPFPSSFPSAKPSGNPTHAPTPRPTGAPSRVPSGMPSVIPSTAPSFATEYATVDSFNLVVSADSIMDTGTIAMFEEECAAFLPIFLPAVYPANFQFVGCELLSQSLVDMSNGRRRLQEEEQDLRWLAVLVRVTARSDLPGNIRFNDLVGQVFGTFKSTLQRNLNSALPYFGNTSRLVPSVEDGPTVSSSTRGNTGSNGKVEDFPILPVAVAAVVGAVLAIGMAAFMLSVKRGRGEDEILPRHSTTISVGSFIVDGDIDDDQKTGTQLSESTNGPFLPPTPIGVRSVPDEIDSESFVEPEGGLSPDSTSSAPREKSKEVQYQYRGSSSDVLGLGRTGTNFNFDRPKSERQGSEMKTAVELERSFDSDGDLGLGQSVSAVDRSLQALKRKTPNEGEWDMDVMKLIGSGSAAVAANNETLATANEGKDEFVVNPLPRRSFFGFAMGFRNQKEAKDSLPHDRVVTPACSVDVSIDPMRAAGTPVGTAKNTFAECKDGSPQGQFLQKNETPSGGEFLQMNVTSAAHTGSVLDDLGKSEQDWKGQLNTTMSATAATPRAGNTQSATPSGGEFLQMNDITAAHTGNVLDDLEKVEQEWKGQLTATMSATAETPRVGNTETANSHRSRRNIYNEC